MKNSMKILPPPYRYRAEVKLPAGYCLRSETKVNVNFITLKVLKYSGVLCLFLKTSKNHFIILFYFRNPDPVSNR